MAAEVAATIAAGCGRDPRARKIIQFLQCHGTAAMSADRENIATLFLCLLAMEALIGVWTTFLRNVTKESEEWATFWTNLRKF